MIRIITISPDEMYNDNEAPWEFAIYDTVIDQFVMYLGCHTFDDDEDLIYCYRNDPDYDGDDERLKRYLRLLPDKFKKSFMK